MISLVISRAQPLTTTLTLKRSELGLTGYANSGSLYDLIEWNNEPVTDPALVTLIDEMQRKIFESLSMPVSLLFGGNSNAHVPNPLSRALARAVDESPDWERK